MATDNQLAEVPVIGDENTPFSYSNGKYPLVGKTGGIVVGNAGHIMSGRGEKGGNTKLRTFIQEELHKLGCPASRAARFSPFPMRSTSALAYSKHALTSSTVSRG